MVPLILLKKWHTRGQLCTILYRIAHDDVGLDGNLVRAQIFSSGPRSLEDMQRICVGKYTYNYYII